MVAVLQPEVAQELEQVLGLQWGLAPLVLVQLVQAQPEQVQPVLDQELEQVRKVELEQVQQPDHHNSKIEKGKKRGACSLFLLIK